MNSHPLILAYIEGNNFGRLIGMDFNVVEKGVVHYTMRIEEKHLATPSAAHGGAIAGLVDAGLGVGALSLVAEEGDVVSTVEFKVNYFKPCLLGDIITAISSPLKVGRTLLFMELALTNQKGELVVKASGTFNRYPKEKAGY